MTGAGPQVAWLPGGDRLHLHHGPIDLVIGAEGPGRSDAFDRAIARFEPLLGSLVTELAWLRQPLGPRDFDDPVARRMARAVAPHRGIFVTPMAAVAGAVADEVLAAMLGPDLAKVYVNNGGDIAFWLGEGQRLSALGPAGEIVVTSRDRPRGLATSGWRGRSFSLGIADAVTVAAASAAEADVAATLIANAVDLPGHPAITRVPAESLCDDSDLRGRRVTAAVGHLTSAEIGRALAAGLTVADGMIARGLIEAATLSLRDRTAVAGHMTGVLNHA